MPPANKFLKVKLSTTELEHNHRPSLANITNNTNNTNNDLSSNTENTNFSFVNLQRHSSLHSADKKFLIKDSFATSYEESTSAEEDEDDVFNSVEKQPTTKLMLKQQEALKLAAKIRAKAGAKQQPNAVERRKNHSLSNASNHNLRSHSVNGQKNCNQQLVPKD